MEKKSVSQLAFFRIGFYILMILNVTFLLLSFRDRKGEGNFEVINAERINVMGTGGKPVLSLSNKRLISGPSMNGKNYPREYSDGRQFFSGIIFYNDDGDEVGGLIYNGFKKDSGYYSMEHLSFDQWKQNQVVAMQYLDNGKSKRAGLRVWDRPKNIPLDEIFDRYKIRNGLTKGSKAYDSVSAAIKVSSERGDNGVERMFIGSQDEEAQIQLR